MNISAFIRLLTRAVSSDRADTAIEFAKFRGVYQDAQRNADRGAKYDRVIGGLTLVLLGVTAVIAGKAWSVSKDQLTTMQNDQRAWLGPPDFRASRHGESVDIIFTLKNFGRTPTRGLFVDANIISGRDDAGAMIAEMCKRGLHIANTVEGFFETSIVPGESALPVKYSKSFDNIPLADIINLENPRIVGCAIYGLTAGDRGIHQTGFVTYMEPSYDEKEFKFPLKWAVRPN